MTVTQTTRIKVHQWDSGSDPFTRSQMTLSHANIETYCARIEKGNSRPAAAAEYDRAFYVDTTAATRRLSFCDGTTWFDVPVLEPLSGGGGAVGTLVADGAGVVGTSTNAARADHIHAAPCNTPVAIGTALAEGGAASFSRSDHVHTIGNGAINATALFTSAVYGGTATTIATAVAAGTSASFSRSDHAHSIGAGAINASNMLGSGVIDALAKFGGGIRPPIVSTSAPSSPTDGDTWSDTNTNQFKVHNGTDWITVGGRPVASILDWSGSQPVAHDTWEKVTGQTTVADPMGLVNQSSVVVDRPGLYWVSCIAQFDGVNESGERAVGYYIGDGQGSRTNLMTNGAGNPERTFTRIKGDSQDQNVAGAELALLQAGDRITLTVYHTGATSIAVEKVRLGVAYIGPSS